MTIKRTITSIVAKCKVFGHRTSEKLKNYLRILVLPGFGGMPLYDVLVFFLNSFTKGRLVDRAAAVAFNFFLALFPLILFFFTLIPYIPIPYLYEQILGLLKEFLLPSGAFDFLVDTINGIMNQPHGGLLSLSVVLCLWFGSSGVSAIFNGFKNAYMDYRSYGWIKQRFYSLILLVILGMLIFMSIALITFGNIPLGILERKEIVTHQFGLWALNAVRWLLSVFNLMLSVSLLYFFGNKSQKRFKLFTPGTLLSTGLFILATVGFNIYISNFSRYNALYGSIGTLIVFLMWLWILAIVILTGNELNNSIYHLSVRESAHVRAADSSNGVVPEDRSKKNVDTFDNTKNKGSWA